MTKQSDNEAAQAYADAHAPVVPNHRALVKTCVSEAYLAGLAAGRAASKPTTDLVEEMDKVDTALRSLGFTRIRWPDL